MDERIDQFICEASQEFLTDLVTRLTGGAADMAVVVANIQAAKDDAPRDWVDNMMNAMTAPRPLLQGVWVPAPLVESHRAAGWKSIETIDGWELLSPPQVWGRSFGYQTISNGVQYSNECYLQPT